MESLKVDTDKLISITDSSIMCNRLYSFLPCNYVGRYVKLYSRDSIINGNSPTKIMHMSVNSEVYFLGIPDDYMFRIHLTLVTSYAGTTGYNNVGSEYSFSLSRSTILDSSADKLKGIIDTEVDKAIKEFRSNMQIDKVAEVLYGNI